jgi:hypothetical protein
MGFIVKSHGHARGVIAGVSFQRRPPARHRNLRPEDHQRHLRPRQRPVRVQGQGGRHRQGPPLQVLRPDRPAAAIPATDRGLVHVTHGGPPAEPDLPVPGRIPAPADQMVPGGSHPAPGRDHPTRREQGRTDQVNIFD